MMFTSSFWLVVIAGGAVAVAVGNIQYQRTRDVEKRKSAAKQTRALLQPELERNRRILEVMLKSLEHGEVEIVEFDTTAWQTVEGSELLLGLPDVELSQIIKVYYLMKRADGLHGRLLESSIGISAALQDSGRTRQRLNESLKSALGELQPILSSVTQPSQHSVQ